MEDAQIIDHFFRRDPEAIRAAQEKYEKRCLAAARHILPDDRDAEECVSDVWLRLWNAIPPERPRSLAAYITTVTRRLARGDLDEMSITESVPALLAICCAHFLRVKKLPCLIGGALDLLHDEFAQLDIIPGAVEQIVVIQLIGNQHHIAGHLRALDLHCPAEQEAFLYRHVLKSPFQPIVLGFGHFKAIQQVKELSGLRARHHIISIPAHSVCFSSLWISPPSLR